STPNPCSETPWPSSGGGVSPYVPKPQYQIDAGLPYLRRSNPDVALDADPNTGYYVRFRGSWYGVGGTSASSPAWAGLIALADQGLLYWVGTDSLDSGTQTLPLLYSLYTDPNYTNYYFCDVGTLGYDLYTGIGSPQSDLLVQALINQAPFGPSPN